MAPAFLVLDRSQECFSILSYDSYPLPQASVIEVHQGLNGGEVILPEDPEQIIGHIGYIFLIPKSCRWFAVLHSLAAGSDWSGDNRVLKCEIISIYGPFGTIMAIIPLS